MKQNARTERQNINPIKYAPSTPTHSVAEQVTSVFGGLFDLPIEFHGTDYEEEPFRRRM